MASLRYMGMNQSTQPVKGGFMVTTFTIDGMRCGSCVRHLSQVLKALPGVVHVAVDLTRNEGRVDHRAQWVGDSALIEAVADAGYAARLATTPSTDVGDSRRGQRCCCG